MTIAPPLNDDLAPPPPDDAAIAKKIAKRNARKARTIASRQRKADALANARLNAPPPAATLHHLHVSALHSVVPAGSIDVIITDPPYPAEYLGVWPQLAAFAAHALKPNGNLLALSGQAYLPQILNAMTTAAPTLQYRWMMAYEMPGAHTFIHTHNVENAWKPILLYRKAPPDGAKPQPSIVDRIKAPWLARQDTRYHHWGQQLDGIRHITEKFALPGQTVCDPFVGGGTGAHAALLWGCQFVGADVDDGALATTVARLREESAWQQLLYPGAPEWRIVQV